MNSITISGRLARDPEYTTDGTPRVNFTVGVDRRTVRDGDKVDWFRCVAWDGERAKTATQISEYFHKGKGIIITGRMENDPYMGKDGRLRESWAIKVERWEFMIQDPKNEHRNQRPGNHSEQQLSNDPEPFTESDTFKAAEDDIPF